MLLTWGGLLVTSAGSPPRFLNAMSMLDATERARPAMAYILELEQKVRGYQNQTRRFQWFWFGLGFAGGAALTAVITIARLFHFR